MVAHSKEAQAKTLIMKAWRERWTDIQWGIHVRSLIESPTADLSFIANCILQQALSGPGPNSLVLSYLMHSIYSQIISTCAVLKSVSKYDGYHKPYCIASLLDLLENIKERIILNDGEELETCLDLAVSLASIIHWLLTCMYSALEKISDLSISDLPSDTEESKIVVKCRKLIEYLMKDPFISGLIYCAVLHDDEVFRNIRDMSIEVAKFSDGHHQQDIIFVTGLIDNIGKRSDPRPSKKIDDIAKSIDGKQIIVGCPTVQTTLICAALLRTANDIPMVAADLVIIKKLKNLSNAQLYSEIFHSIFVGLIDCLSKQQELKIVGFTFLVLPGLIHYLAESLSATATELVEGLKLFLDNDSILDVVDTKLNCSTLEQLLQKIHIIKDSDKRDLLQRKTQRAPSQKQSSSSAVLIIKAETTLQSILKTLDGDYTKNQDAILSVLCDMLGKSFDLILTAAFSTKKLPVLSSKLIKLNQSSRQVTGEAGKGSATRASIFDITFLMLCHIVQTYGSKAVPSEDDDSFFVSWYNDCMIENDTVKNPEAILNRCDQNKVELLLNQYLQGGDSELKTSLVFWHDLCTNVVGVVRELLLAWESGSVSFSEVSKILDVFKSRICSLPVCISAWLCSHIQITTEEQAGKAKYILNYFMFPPTTSSDDSQMQDSFKDRYSTMSKIITKMVNCVQPSSSASSSPLSPTICNMESKPVDDLYKKCWASMQSRGLVDNETMLSLKSLLEISGSPYFVQKMVNEMMGNQSSVDLLQWSDMLYGIFHVNLHECTTALLRIVVPSMMLFWNRDSNFVEPQILALVSLSVDCILSYYYHVQRALNSESEEDGGERAAKRRKISTDASSSETKEHKLSDLEFMLKELFEEFDKNLKCKLEARPQVIFILRFLEHLSMKSPSDSNLMSSLPNSVIMQLMSLMCDEINTKMLLGWHTLTQKSSRSNCVQAICTLRQMQNVNKHRFVGLV